MKREDATIDNVRIHCGQSMRYEAIDNGDVFDNQRLTGTYYCERCSMMQPIYETIAPERWRQTLEVLRSTVKGLQSHPYRYAQTVVDRYLYFMETEIDKALNNQKGPFRMKPIGATKEWRVEPRPIHGYQVIDSDGTEILADVYRKEDAELIVNAVNERERLREALRKLRDSSNQHTCNGGGSNCDRCSALELADAALNEVEG